MSPYIRFVRYNACSSILVPTHTCIKDPQICELSRSRPIFFVGSKLVHKKVQNNNITIAENHFPKGYFTAIWDELSVAGWSKSCVPVYIYFLSFLCAVSFCKNCGTSSYRRRSPCLYDSFINTFCMNCKIVTIQRYHITTMDVQSRTIFSLIKTIFN